MKEYSSDAAEKYESHFAPALAPWTAELVDLANPGPDERILDIACGTGAVARALADRVGQNATIAGVDLSPPMVDVARKLASEAIEVEWWVAPADALPFSDESFDLALCQQSLQFFPDRAAALREAHRVLASGGRLVLNVWTSIDRCPGQLALAEALDRHVGGDAGDIVRLPFALADAGELRSLLEEGGFRDISIRTTSGALRWPSPDEYVHRYVSISPAAEAFEAAGERARSAVVDEVSRRVERLVQDGELVFPIEANVVRAYA